MDELYFINKNPDILVNYYVSIILKKIGRLR